MQELNWQPTSELSNELIRVVHRVHEVLTLYGGDDWELKALWDEEGRQEFKDIHSEIKDCIELIFAAAFQGSSSLGEKTMVSAAYNKFLSQGTDPRDLHSAAVNDRKQLSRKVQDEETLLQQLVSYVLTEKSAAQIEPSHLSHITGHLGQGAYGTVYRVQWLNREFAVKSFGRNDDKSFQRELGPMANFKHPNIIRITGFSNQEHGQQLVMEKMDMDLARYLEKKKKLSMVASTHIMFQIANAMAWLHYNNVIHRGLKPANVLVKGDDELQLKVKISDFGLARTDYMTSFVSNATAKVGTRSFMAPEVWKSEPGSSSYSKRSDVFSYAMICYQLVTGNQPMVVLMKKNKVNPDKFMDSVYDGVRPELDSGHDDVSLELVELIRRCWSHEVNDRPGFEEIVDKLKHVKAICLSNIKDIRTVCQEMRYGK